MLFRFSERKMRMQIKGTPGIISSPSLTFRLQCSLSPGARTSAARFFDNDTELYFALHCPCLSRGFPVKKVHCRSPGGTVRVQCRCNPGAMLVQCRCSAGAMQVPFENIGNESWWAFAIRDPPLGQHLTGSAESGTVCLRSS